jgi:hypothetical protein
VGQRRAAAESTYERTKTAAETPGAVAGNGLILAQKQTEAAQALLKSRQQASKTAEAAVAALNDLQGYLGMTAPFNGVVTDRPVPPGASSARETMSCCWSFSIFVIRDRGDRAEWVDVKKGATDGDLAEVVGNLKPGRRSREARHDELREGSRIR